MSTSCWPIWALNLRAVGRWSCPAFFFGGGTPSLFGGPAIERLLSGIARQARFAADIEITLEANPGSAESARFSAYRAAGVNRLSLGIQSFNDERLNALGRVHQASEAYAAIEFARRAGFDNFNLDLMFGLPGAQVGDALDDLQAAIDAAPTHLSWYQLTLEQGTAFARNPPQLPSHDQICDDYDAGLELLAAAGFEQYEISAYARSGRKARHNLNYWQFGDYLGIGAGAHGKINVAGKIYRRAKIRHPERYMKSVLAGEPTVVEERIHAARVVSEFMLNALRLKEGFSLGDFSRTTGVPVGAPVVAAPLARAVQLNWLETHGDRVTPTANGFRFLNDLQLLFIDDGESQSTDSAGVI